MCSVGIRCTTRNNSAGLKQGKEAGLIPEEQVRLCVVCDGAEWIWKHVQALFPHARQVLDYYHCAPVPPSGRQSPLWRLGAGRRMGRSDPDAALPRQSGCGLGGLQRMQAQSDEAAQAIANCWAYLNEHRGRTAYQKLRRGAIRWAVGESNRPTSSFVTCGSSVRVPGGMSSTATRCWPCAVPSITGPSIRCLRVINSGYGKRRITECSR